MPQTSITSTAKIKINEENKKKPGAAHVRISCYIPGTSQQSIDTQIHRHQMGFIVYIATKDAQHSRAHAHNYAARAIHVVYPAGNGFSVGGYDLKINYRKGLIKAKRHQTLHTTHLFRDEIWSPANCPHNSVQYLRPRLL